MSFDAVLSGLVSTFTAAAPAGVEVWDGEPYDPQQATFLAVGWDESDQPSVSLSSQVGDIGNAQDWDSYDVSCLLSSWAGNLTPAQLRTQIDAAFTTFQQALRANPQLGGAAMLARITSAEYLQNKRPEGLLGQIRFTATAIAQ